MISPVIGHTNETAFKFVSASESGSKELLDRKENISTLIEKARRESIFREKPDLTADAAKSQYKFSALFPKKTVEQFYNQSGDQFTRELVIPSTKQQSASALKVDSTSNRELTNQVIADD